MPASMLRRFLVASLVAFMALSLPGGARAQDADVREVQRYVLTSAGLAKYTQAARKLSELAADRAQACRDGEDDDETDADSMSISALVAKVESTPGARAAIQSAGLTPREYVVFTLSLLQNGLAAWAVQQPGAKLPPGISQANIDFVRAHDAELRQLRQYSRKPDCEDDAGEVEAEA